MTFRVRNISNQFHSNAKDSCLGIAVQSEQITARAVRSWFCDFTNGWLPMAAEIRAGAASNAARPRCDESGGCGISRRSPVDSSRAQAGRPGVHPKKTGKMKRPDQEFGRCFKNKSLEKYFGHVDFAVCGSTSKWRARIQAAESEADPAPNPTYI